MSQLILRQTTPSVLKITMKSEEEGKYNLVNVKFMRNFMDTLRQIDRESSIRFVILRGQGNFGAGADIKELRQALENREHANSFFVTMFEMFRTLFNFSKPIIANVEGIAYGASMEILLGCDFVIASENAKFAAPGGKIGVFPPVLVTVGKDILGWKVVRDMAFLGKELTSKEGKEVGLVYEISDNFEETGHKIIQELKQMAPSSLTQMRRLIFRKYEEDLKYAFNKLAEQVQTEDAKSGILSFISRTKPYWSI